MALADPAPDHLLPDVEALVAETVHALGDVTVWLYAVFPLPGPPGWLSAQSVQVDARAGSKVLAFDRARAVRRAVLHLTGQSFDTGVVGSVDVVDGPRWVPDPNGHPCYSTRFELRVRPL